MAYTPTEWKDLDFITDVKLNKLEAAVAEANEDNIIELSEGTLYAALAATQTAITSALTVGQIGAIRDATQDINPTDEEYESIVAALNKVSEHGVLSVVSLGEDMVAMTGASSKFNQGESWYEKDLLFHVPLYPVQNAAMVSLTLDLHVVTPTNPVDPEHPNFGSITVYAQVLDIFGQA